MTHDIFENAAAVCAETVLENLARHYPYAAHHTERSAEDLHTPAHLHPAFHSSYDWHSCVHMHWLGASVLNSVHEGRDALREDAGRALAGALHANLTREKLAAEAAYLRANPGWERPYGWAWLVRLAATAHASGLGALRSWADNLAEAVDVIAENTIRWTSLTEHPVRHGVHSNSAFGLALLLDGFRTLGHEEAAAACEDAAHRWFAHDAGWPAEWELSGHDFLSAGLAEADLMWRVMPVEEYAEWFMNFLPGLDGGSRILAPVNVADETDGQMVHQHGLNLSRAGQLARISTALESSERELDVVPVLRTAVVPLFEAGLKGVASRDFMSSHWLASFAWDARESLRAQEARQ